MRKSGFTLIELLVVIAIIAILAAILFPVFAQAKLAAKAAASLSNIKQISTSSIMYSNDYDDVVPMAGQWGICDADALYPDASCTNPNTNYVTWAFSLYPYTKNIDIYSSPLGAAASIAGEVKKRTGTWYMSYGYNYTYLNPAPFGGSVVKQSPVSFTGVQQPADTIMFTEHVARGSQGSNPLNNPWSLGPGTAIWLGLAEIPDCATNTAYNCIDGWGNDGPYAQSISKIEEGKYTGGNAPRKANQILVAWTDGHASWKPKSALAAGTTWKDLATGVPASSITINDISKYLWDTN